MYYACSLALSKEISSIHFFNIALQVAFANWKARHLNDHGWLLTSSFERVCNSRFADDMLLYANMITELESIVEILFIELQAIGFDPNSKQD